MDAKLLIDSVMRQTTVLIAQLSTTAGIRAPLAHVADEVFLNLSQELEAEGLSRKVVADMFGLAIRGYQRRVQRLRESATSRGKTLWQAVLEVLHEERRMTRRELYARFERDDPALVGAVLSDLLTSGLAYKTGGGANAVFGATVEEDRQALARAGKLETAVALAWLEVYRHPGTTRQELGAHVTFDAGTLGAAIDALVAQGRVEERDGRLYTGALVIPVGASAGWEAAVFDHFQTVCVAIATKLRQGQVRSEASDVTGGATLSFVVCDGHPHADQVYGLLARVRAEVNELWQAVESYNEAHPIAEDARREVSFYFGQCVESKEGEG